MWKMVLKSDPVTCWCKHGKRVGRWREAGFISPGQPADAERPLDLMTLPLLYLRVGSQSFSDVLWDVFVGS